MAALAHHAGDGLPLLLGRIHASGVVRTGVEEHHGAAGSLAEVLEHAVEVKVASLGVPVTVRSRLEVSVLGDGEVVAPSRVGVEHGGLVQEAAEEVSAHAEGTSTRERLDGSNALLLDGRGVLAEENLDGESSHLGITTLGKVLLVERLVSEDEVLSSADAVKNLGLAIISAISTNGDVHLAGVGISAVEGGHTEDRI